MLADDRAHGGWDVPERPIDPPDDDDLVECPICEGGGCGFCFAAGVVPRWVLNGDDQSAATDAAIDRKMEASDG